METALILAIISLVGTVVTGVIATVGKIRRSSCGIFSCESHNNIEDVVAEVFEASQNNIEDVVAEVIEASHEREEN